MKNPDGTPMGPAPKGYEDPEFEEGE